jgi:methyl acetate hydrolase
MHAVLSEAVARGELPFGEVAVFGREGLRAHGSAGIAAGAVYRMASMAKPVATVLALILAERGRLDLDAPIGRYLPAYANWPVLVRVDATSDTLHTRAACRPITVRHLLTHTAGFSYGFSNETCAELMRAGHHSETDWPLLHDPGERWTYGCSTSVLGFVVEAVTGRAYRHVVQDEVFAPLGMCDTASGEPVGGWERVAHLYQREGAHLVRQPAPSQPVLIYPRADGGLFGTVADYGRFVRMLLCEGRLDGVRVLSQVSVRAMFRDQLGGMRIALQHASMPRLAMPFPEHAGIDGFGLGLQLRAQDVSGLRAAGSGSWAGLFNTHFWVDPARGIAAVFHTQVLPFCDPGVMNALKAFERATYAPSTG